MFRTGSIGLALRWTLILLVVPGLLSAQDLAELRSRANSDDAESVAEASFHAQARATVIRHVEPNGLRVGGRDFRVKRNPAGPGCFVYEPRTRFDGVERKLVWWVNEEGAAFAVNGAAKGITPALEFPRGQRVQPAHQVVAYVFDETALPDLPEAVAPSGDGFTVKEYHAYRIAIDAPMSVSDQQSYRNAAQCLGMTAAEAEAAVDKVQRALFRNRWMGPPNMEVRHASDWDGEPPRPNC